MKGGLRLSMAWLHTWCGLLVCWLLMLVYVSGTASYYRDEITCWMKPELALALESRGATGVAVTTPQAVAAGLAFLARRAPDATRWLIELPSARMPALAVSWVEPKGTGGAGVKKRARQDQVLVDPATGLELPKPRDTQGGDFLFRLHFDLHYLPIIWGRWIVGFCAMFMLVAILSGVVTHKRIFQDFFTFRPKKGQRSWLDGHNAAAVLALPFHLMITYTGLVTLMFMYMPSPKQALYGADQKTWLAEAYPQTGRKVTPSGLSAPPVPLAPLLEQAPRRWHGAAPGRIIIDWPGDASATIALVREGGHALSNNEPSVVFGLATGAIIAAEDYDSVAASEARRAVYGLHLGRFADPLLRALFFICGLAGCAMVATGALLWAVKARQKAVKAGKVGFGLRLVDGLNIGAIAGLPIAYAAFFWANRLLPLDLGGRADREIACFFGAWALAAVLAQLRPTRSMWRCQLWLAAALLCGLLPLNLATTGVNPGGFELVLVTLGSLLAAIAWQLGRRAPSQGDN